MVVVNACHEYLNDTCGSGIVSCAADVPGMSVVRGTKGDGVFQIFWLSYICIVH